MPIYYIICHNDNNLNKRRSLYWLEYIDSEFFQRRLYLRCHFICLAKAYNHLCCRTNVNGLWLSLSANLYLAWLCQHEPIHFIIMSTTSISCCPYPLMNIGRTINRYILQIFVTRLYMIGISDMKGQRYMRLPLQLLCHIIRYVQINITLLR